MADDGPVTGQVELPDGTTVTLATPQARIIARVVDLFWYTGLLYILDLLFRSDYLRDLVGNPDSADYRGFNIESAGILFLAFLIVTIDSVEWTRGRKEVTSQSIGQSWTGVRIVAARDGGPFPLRSLVARAHIPYAAYLVARFLFNQTGFDEGVRWELSWTVVAVPILPMFWSSYRQGWHDNAAGTIAIAEESNAAIFWDASKDWCKELRPLARLRSIGKCIVKSLASLFRGPLTWLIAVFGSLRYYLGLFNLFVMPIFGIVFWLDYMGDTSREECYAVLDTIYEQASIEQLEASESPHVFVDTLIVPTLENRDRLLDIEYLKTVSTDNNCDFDSLQRHAKSWGSDYRDRLYQRDNNPDIIMLDEQWSKFPKD